jgi:hypothetical protein
MLDAKRFVPGGRVVVSIEGITRHALGHAVRNGSVHGCVLTHFPGARGGLGLIVKLDDGAGTFGSWPGELEQEDGGSDSNT